MQLATDVTDWFRDFCRNLLINPTLVSRIKYQYERITRQLNLSYWGIDSSVKHSLYVGSYGRDTDIVTSDIDILFILPSWVKNRIDGHYGNGQSALLQEVKRAIAGTYPLTRMGGDGQVIVARFSTGIRFEIVPCFENSDQSFTYPDTHLGGSWKRTDPRPEISAVNSMNNATSKNMKALCRMARAWKNKWSVPVGGLLIDTLAYNFLLSTNYYDDKSHLFYDYLSRDFFRYLSEQDPNQSYWSALGSNQHAYRRGSFERKAKKCYQLSEYAIEKERFPSRAKSIWRMIYGTRFPA